MNVFQWIDQICELVNFSMSRNRLLYSIALIIVISLGLLSRKYAIHYPLVVNTYLGDALWALMIFLLFAFVFWQKKIAFVALLSLLFCYVIEISQLYHAPWIDQLRNTTFGRLILGYGFLWSDIMAYTIGIGVGVLLEKTVANYFSTFFFKFKK